MNDDNNWRGQNIPRVHQEPGGSTFAILPLLECFLEYDEDTIDELLPSAESYGWGDEFANSYAWANNSDKVIYFTPDFTRYGCLPDWFPTTDRQERQLTEQGQVDRFLYLLDYAYGGLLDDHSAMPPHLIAQAIIELNENMGDYVDLEEEDEMEWELA